MCGRRGLSARWTPTAIAIQSPQTGCPHCDIFQADDITGAKAYLTDALSSIFQLGGIFTGYPKIERLQVLGWWRQFS